MATGKVVVKLLKPDGAGHMQRIFNHYIGTDPKYKEEGGDQHQTNPPSTDSSSSSSSSSISPPASSYTTPASLDYLEFMNLLIDLVGTEAAGIDAKGLYEYYSRVDMSIRTATETKEKKEGSSSTAAEEDPSATIIPGHYLTFRVFPALLADLAVRLNPDHDENAARLRFMRKMVLPLSQRLLASSSSSGTTNDETTAGTSSSKNTDPNDTPIVTPITASPPKVPSSKITEPTTVDSYFYSSSPSKVSYPGNTIDTLNDKDYVYNNNNILSSELPPSPSSIGNDNTASNNPLLTNDTPTDAQPGIPTNTNVGVPSSSSSFSNDDNSDNNDNNFIPTPNTYHNKKYDAVLPRYMLPKGKTPRRNRTGSNQDEEEKDIVGGTAVPVATFQSFLQRQIQAEEVRKIKAEQRVHSVTIAERGGNGIPEISKGSKRILAKIADKLTDLPNGTENNSNNVTDGTTGSGGGNNGLMTPGGKHYMRRTISSSSQMVTNKPSNDNGNLPNNLDEDGWPSSVPSTVTNNNNNSLSPPKTKSLKAGPHSHAPAIDPTHLPHFMQRTVSSSGGHPMEGDHHNPHAEVGHTHPTVEPVGHALYRNAVNKVKRQNALVAESLAEESRLRNTKHANSRSEAFLRRRLAREVAAACVYIAAQRASGAYPPVPGLASTDGGPELLPWWLLGLTPGDVATVLHHTGFFTGASLSHAAATRAVKILCAPGADPARDPLPSIPDMNNVANALSISSADGFTIHEGTITAVMVENCRNLAKVWHAAVVGSENNLEMSVKEEGTTDNNTTTTAAADTKNNSAVPSVRMTHGAVVPLLPAARLLALLQALITGAYDVRPEILVAASNDIGMEQPLVLVKVTEAVVKSPKSPRTKGSRSPRGSSSVISSSPSVTSMKTGYTAKHETISERLSHTEMHAVEHKTHGISINGNVDSLEARAGLLAGMKNNHGDIPMAFQKILHDHTAKLHELQHIMSEKGDDLVSTTNKHLTESTNGKPAPKPCPATAGLAVPIPILADEVIGARAFFSGSVLGPLKTLYTNRLAYLTILSRDDGKRAVAAAAAREIIVSRPMESASDNEGEDPFVRASGGGIFASALHGGHNGNGMGLFRQRGSKNTGIANNRVSHRYDDDECTFAPLLCKKSIELANEKESRMTIAIPSRAHGGTSPPRHTTVQESHYPIVPIPREAMMIHYKAQVEERCRAMREIKEAAELAACTFKPDISASWGTNNAGNRRSASSMNGVSGTLAGVYVPNYSSLVNTALNSVPGAEIKGNGLSEAPWVAKAARLDAVSLAGKSRNEWLYHLAAIRNAAIDHAHQVQQELLQNAELQGCTFRPTTNWGRRVGRNGVVRKNATNAATTTTNNNGPVTGGVSESSVSRSNVSSVERTTDTNNNNTNDTTNTNDDSVDGWLSNRNVAGAVQDNDDDDNDEQEGIDNDSVVEIEIPLTVGTDAALVLSRRAVQPHLLTKQPNANMNPPSREASIEQGGTGKASVMVSQKLLTTSRGLDSHLRRVLKGRAEKEEKRRLDMALSAGVLHKRAVVRDSTGHTVVKPFAFVTEFRALAHGGYIEAETTVPVPSPPKYVQVPVITSPPKTNSIMMDNNNRNNDVQSVTQNTSVLNYPTNYGDAGRMGPVDATTAQALVSSSSTASLVNSTINGSGLRSPMVPFGTASSASAASQTLTFPAGEPPLLYVDVTVSAGSVERIPVWRDSDLTVLAAEFASKHGLTRKMARRLERMIASEANRAGITLSNSMINNESSKQELSTTGQE